MTDPPLNPDPPEPSWIGQLIALGKLYYPTIRDFVIVLGVLAGIATNVVNGCNHTAQINAVHQDVNSAKDVTVNTNQAAHAIAGGIEPLAKDRLGDNAPAVKALESTTPPTAQPSK